MPIVNKPKDVKLNSQDDKVKQNFFSQQNLNVFFIKYYNWVVYLTAVLIVAVGYFLLIQPKYQEINNNQLAIQKQVEQPFSGNKNKLAEFIKTEKAYNEIKQIDKEKIQAILPDKADVEKLIVEIESIVLKNGLILTSLSTQSTEEKKIKSSAPINNSNKPESKLISSPESVASVKISLTVAGADYVGFKNLLKTIENNIRLMDIKNIKYNYNVEKSEVNLDLVVYYFS
ncbi:MAG: type 4a pilus biogenesis protein PilO [Patescibacteria group bacterium]